MPDFNKISKALSASRKHSPGPNGCWYLDWEELENHIGRFTPHACTTSGTSGIMMHKQQKLYFYLHHPTNQFVVELF